MSKWKAPGVKITQIAMGYSTVMGLGSDNKVYGWDDTKGKWEKDWNQDEED